MIPLHAARTWANQAPAMRKAALAARAYANELQNYAVAYEKLALLSENAHSEAMTEDRLVNASDNAAFYENTLPGIQAAYENAVVELASL